MSAHTSGPQSHQLALFADDVEERVREILASRRKHNASGQKGEDADLIRAAIEAATGVKP